MQIRILLAEDSADDAVLLERVLRKGGYDPYIHRVDTDAAMRESLKSHQWDLVISDHNMPGMSSDSVLSTVKEFGLDVPFIIVSGSIGEDIAVSAMKMGAHDYIMKNNLARLVPAIGRELRDAETRQAHKHAQEVIHHLAHHDSLTGLANRYDFESRIERELADAEMQSDVIYYIDLDQFKIINDTCGHVAGDELLRQLAMLLKERIRLGDILARLGGDEFGVLLKNCGLENATRIAQQFLDVIKDFRFSWADKTFSIGASIGIVQFNSKLFADKTAVLSAADLACYAAKDSGRNRYHIYSQDDVQLAKRHGEMQWATRINDALEHNHFVLYQQKILPIATQAGQVCNAEFLLRMLGPAGEHILPGAFLPAAERFNLTSKIDYWVVNKVFSMLSELHKGTGEPNVAFINLSGASLGDGDFFKYVYKQVKEYKINPARVCFEITETTAITNLSSAVMFIREIKSLGFKFALDDFGTGLCSFTYLKKFPIDYLKIDGSFIRDMLSDPMDAAIVDAINRIGHVAGLKTVAEFVESPLILDKLVEFGLDFAQGYAIDIPHCVT